MSTFPSPLLPAGAGSALLRKLYFCTVVACACAVSVHAAELIGVVVDPSGMPIVGAQVAVFTQTGIVTRQITNEKGAFDIYVSPLYDTALLRVTAAGFTTATVGMGASQIQLKYAAQADSVRAMGSAVDSPSSLQGSGVSTVTSLDLRERNEAQAFDLLRELPGVLLAQAGPRGAVTGMYVRGDDPKNNLITLNGIPVNSFSGGGLFNFAYLPADLIEEVDLVRGPQSGVYGSYAAGSAVNFQTRTPSDGAAFDAVAEGGTHEENREALGGSGMPFRDLGIAGSLSHLESNGGAPNKDYRNDDGFLSTSYRWRTQNLFAFGNFDWNEFGGGPDATMREKNNVSTYGLHWQDGITDNLRADVFAGWFQDDSLVDKDTRANGDGRLTYAVNKYWSMAGGYDFSHEETRDTLVLNTAGNTFLLRRDDGGAYWENRVTIAKFYLNASVREEIYQTAVTDRTDTRLDLKLAGAYSIDKNTRLHASYGTGIRPPGGMDLAFTNNPALKPERTQGYDIGVTERFLSDRLSLDATWFRNRYKDMIVDLGGLPVTLSPYSTDNLGSALAKGVEASARFRPLTWISLTGNYTWLETEALALDGGPGLIQQYFYLGQPLLGRPKQSGSAVATFHYGRLDTNLVGYFRGHSLDADPNGATDGLFRNHGYQNLGINVNFRVKGNITVYGNLRNALDERYEEVYVYPNPLLNFVAGVKWNLARAR